MNTAFLAELSQARVRLSVENGRLCARGPKGAVTPDILRQLKEHKDELLEMLAGSTIPRAPQGERLPLSFAQQRLWFLDQWESGSSVYNMPVALDLRGDLDVLHLRGALEAILARHDSLRTVFPHGGEPEQQVLPAAALALPVEEVEEAELSARANAEALAPFDLSAGPLTRFRLLRVEPRRHVFLVTMHHIVSDGWSMGVFLRELHALYRGESLPPLSVQYGDYAVWQRRRFDQGGMARQLKYWRGRLAGAPPLLQLPLDRPRPAYQSFAGAVTSFRLEPSLVRRLEALAHDRGGTLFMSLLAGLATLLHRWSGQDDLVLGTPIANRQPSELEPLIGFFANTLALRLDASGDPSFLDFLDRSVRSSLDAFTHQDLPFEQVVEALNPERSPSHPAIFQVMLVLQNTPESGADDGGLSLRMLPLKRETAKVDLTVTFAPEAGALVGEIEYCTDLFEEGTVAALAGQLVFVLEKASQAPETPLSRLPLLTPEQRQRLLQRWDCTAAPASSPVLPELLAQQAEKSPRAIAVESSAERLSHGELRRRVLVLAERLRALGLGPEKLAAVCVERSVDMVAALLAVWETGAAYVPLDPEFPRDRLGFMLADSDPAVVVTEIALASTVESGAPRLLLDAVDWSATATSRPCPARPDSLAYVIYTSGSTGKPKGVEIEHGALLNFMLGMRAELGLDADDALLAVTTISFDIAALELYLPLLGGGRVFVAPRADAIDGGRLKSLLASSRATVMQATPASWRLLQMSGWQPDPNLKILCGGEAMPTDLSAWLRSRDSRVWNLYGPTETTVWSLVYRVGSARPSGGVEPIGHPIRNTTLFLLDPNGEPVPQGVAAEVWLGGDGLARGYHKRPELTAERFPKNPFGGGRLYRTGDVARLRRDGVVEFLGRADHQVKIRGFRVELGEIEQALVAQPGIEVAVAVVREHLDGERQLIAYVVPDSGAPELEASGEMEASHLEESREVWDGTYEGQGGDVDPCFDTSGWISSFTGRRIPDGEMREWLDITMEELRPLAAQRVLEIGCGTGMVTSRLAPGADRYRALDLSERAVRRIERLQSLRPELAHVEVRQGDAASLDGVEGPFDLVVLNSVIQYFPSLDYLRRVLNAAVARLAPGGAVFVGDVRDFDQLAAFHEAVLKHKGQGLSPRRVAEAVSLEPELTVAPAFFHSLGLSAGIERKRGRHANEMNLFRYDVILRRNGTAPTESRGGEFANDPLRGRLIRRLMPRLREGLAKSLPPYMVPAAIVVLDALPLTANRKVDRKALPRPEAVQSASSRGHVPPRTPTEEKVAAAFADLLGLDRVGAFDHFFELGGHSLLAARLVVALRSVAALSPRHVFEHSTVAALAAQLDSQAPRVQEAIPIADRGGRLPLSFPQQRLWFLDQMDGPQATYVMPAAFHLSGPLDLGALRGALNAGVARHESLRTLFPAEDGVPRQEILPRLDVELPVLEAADRAEAARLAEAEANRPFDLAKGPFLRATLLRLERDEHVLLLSLSHMVCDLWSMGILLSEIGRHYDVVRKRAALSLEPLAIQYPDFAAWQHARLEGEGSREMLEWWRSRLAGIPSRLSLPTDFPPPQVVRHDGAVERFRVSAEKRTAMKALAVEANTTPFVVCLAAFGILLGRHAGQEDLVIGTPVAGRVRAELEPLVGFFANTVALRLDLSGGPTFRELLARVREVSLESMARQELPFELLVEALRPVRSLAHNPIFQVMLSYQNVALEAHVFTDITVTSMVPAATPAKFELNLTLSETGGGLDGELKYRSDLFAPATAWRFVRQWRRLLDSALESPDSPIDELPLEEASASTLPELAPPPTVTCLHALVSRRVPDHPALIGADGKVMTYGALVERSARWAGRLLRLLPSGAGAIGLALPRGFDALTALLSVLKAGKAYVPLDPTLPDERLAFMASEAGLQAVLGDPELSRRIPGIPVFTPGEDWRDDPVSLTEPAEALACILFTSGSTGRPKGVMLGHGAIAHHLDWALRALPLAPDDRVLQKTPFGFDPSLWEIFATLAAGATLVLAEPDGHKRPDHLVDLVRSRKVTHLRVVPTLLRMLVESGRLAECAGLRRLLCGGEALPPELLAEAQAVLPRTEIVNVYGPMEACVNSTFWRAFPGASRVPIGGAIDQAWVLLLDDRMRPVADGTPGEIWIGGPALAQGYVSRPDLTAERFAPNPFGLGRLYRSGDIGRRDGTGAIEFLGRRDNQVKLRGYRIEIEEVEAVLGTHPAVAEAAVAAEDQGLTAWVVAKGAVSAGELAAWMKARVPDYMVPGRLLQLDSLPRRPNGKIDRGALSAKGHSEGSALEVGHAYVAPQGPVQTRLAELWCDLLGRELVGATDDFFALGGHSLTAARMVARIRQAFGVDIPLRALFEAPVLSDLATRVEKTAPAAPQPRIVKVDRTQVLRPRVDVNHRGTEKGNG